MFSLSIIVFETDPYTMYSRYAAVCGCLSVVVPLSKIDKFQWRSEEDLRLGVAYGFDDVDWAKSTQDQVLPTLINYENHINEVSLENFIKKCELHFIS